MVNRFYVHRISKLLDELVLTAGMTVSISDEGVEPPLQPQQIEAARSLAASMGVDMVHENTGGANILSFKKR